MYCIIVLIYFQLYIYHIHDISLQTSIIISYEKCLQIATWCEASDHRVEEILTALRAVASAQEKSKHPTWFVMVQGKPFKEHLALCHYWIWCSFKCPVTDYIHMQHSIFEDTFWIFFGSRGLSEHVVWFSSLRWLTVRYVLRDFPPPMTWHWLEPKCLRLSKKVSVLSHKGSILGELYPFKTSDQFDSWVSWHLPLFFGAWGHPTMQISGRIGLS